MSGGYEQRVLWRASKVRLLALDVDGVLTPGTIVYTDAGEQVQSFHVRDGLGLKLLMRAGIEVAIISSRSSEALAKRVDELEIRRSYQGVKDKIYVYNSLIEELGLRDEEAAYVGDDWVDIPVLKRVGLPVVVADAAFPLKDYASFVTRQPGGHGAVREVCDLILTARGLWNNVLESVISA